MVRLNRRYADVIHLFGAAGVVHLCIALAAYWVPEMGDLITFKRWANQAYVLGIHQAYAQPDFRFDWLPLYLYVSKAVGALFYLSGLRDMLGPESRALSFMLKTSMIALHLGTGGLVFWICAHLKLSRRQALTATGFYLFNPGLVLATDVFGFQDALHTAIVFGAAVLLCQKKLWWVPVFCALTLLAKPQGVIYLVPIVAYAIWENGFVWGAKGFLLGVATTVFALMPFIVYGQMDGVIHMYLEVPRVHQWLTGCAHNLWWIFRPAPPFYGDRTPLLWGINGLEIGLIFLALTTLGCCAKLYRHRDVTHLLDACAFLGFAFFMVVTEIHENHLYAMFAFLAPLAAVGVRHRVYYAVLSITFGLNMALAIWWLKTGDTVTLGLLRLSMVNAWINAGVLVAWGCDFFWGRRGFDAHVSGAPSVR